MWVTRQPLTTPGWTRPLVRSLARSLGGSISSNDVHRVNAHVKPPNVFGSDSDSDSGALGSDAAYHSLSSLMGAT